MPVFRLRNIFGKVVTKLKNDVMEEPSNRHDRIFHKALK